MGGVLWSKPVEIKLDGLGFQSPIQRDFDITEALDKLEQLLRASANNYRPSSLPPALVAAFYLGANPLQLTQLYEKWVESICEEWPHEDPVAESVGKFNLHEFYGDQEHEQRFYEYFRDCFTEDLSWEQVVRSHSEQLWPRFSHQQFSPLVQLASAIESDNDLTVSLALAMACANTVGEVNPPTTKDVPKPKQVDGAYMANKLRLLAGKALKTQSYEAVVPVHACAEVFLRLKGNVFGFEPSITLLESVDKYLNSTTFPKLETVGPKQALDSEDWKLITYTRSRMVLEKLAI